MYEGEDPLRQRLRLEAGRVAQGIVLEPEEPEGVYTTKVGSLVLNLIGCALLLFFAQESVGTMTPK